LLLHWRNGLLLLLLLLLLRHAIGCTHLLHCLRRDGLLVRCIRGRVIVGVRGRRWLHWTVRI
jgi:hypothetical protein